MDRRNFLKSSITLCGVGVVGSLAFLESCKKSNPPTTNSFTLDLTQSANSALNNSGGYIYSNGVVVANHNGSFIAVAEACTHNGCSVQYNGSGNNFICPCHNGVFNANGTVKSGPPPTALKKYTVSKSGSILTITG